MSKHRGHLIDVNENHDLLMSNEYHHSSSNSRAITELQAKLNSYKRELEKKDEVINELSTVSPRIPNQYSASRSYAHTSWDHRLTDPVLGDRGEVAALQMKTENLSSEIREYRSKMELKDNYLRELKAKMDIMSENGQRQTAVIQALRDRIRTAESDSGALEQASTQSSTMIAALQKSNRDAQEKIVELEARLRDRAIASEEAEQTTEAQDRKIKDILIKITDLLHIPVTTDVVEASDEIIEKMKEISESKILLESSVATLEDALNAHNLETKASRETIMRLVSEVGKEQKSMTESNYALEQSKKDCEDAVLKKECLERENELLRERLEAMEKALDSSRTELIQTRTKATTSSEDYHRLNHDLSASVAEFQAFKDTIAKLLSNHYLELDPGEEAIKGRIKELMSSEREKMAKIGALDEQVSELNKQLEQQCDLYQNTIRRAKHVEYSTHKQEDRLRDLESELISGSIRTDTLRKDKERYMAFLQDMSAAMGMDRVAHDIGYDMNTDVLVARATQLSKLECDTLVEKTSANHNLHRKIKQLKEQLQSKELHIDLLRKKVSQQDEKENTRSALMIDRDDAIVSVQKLHKKIERLQHALGDERVKVTQLKAQLADTNQLKVFTLEQRNKIDDLSSSLDRLTTTKDRQKKKLFCLKKELKMTENDASETNSSMQQQLQSVTHDLKSSKTLLAEIGRREKQLIDFREVVARMLGLDVTTLAVPDYEVISRLEKLIRSHHVGSAAATSVERQLERMGEHFGRGYNTPAQQLGSSVEAQTEEFRRPRSHSPRRHHHHHKYNDNYHHHHERHRSRSPSPRRY